MTHLGYLLVGWGVTLGVIGLYSVNLIRRGRDLIGQVPADRSRWMTTEADEK